MRTEKPPIYRNYSVLILLAIIGGLTFLYFHKEAGYKQRERQFEAEIKAINKSWADSLNHENLRALLVFQSYAKKLRR